jgi:hypothetical protein
MSKELSRNREIKENNWCWGVGGSRVARFFLVHGTKNMKNIPNEHKMHQMVIKYPKCP